jgi:hypothetical protein
LPFRATRLVDGRRRSGSLLETAGRVAHSRRFQLAFFACLAVAILCGVLFV